jgi:hypothetical protein
VYVGDLAARRYNLNGHGDGIADVVTVGIVVGAAVGVAALSTRFRSSVPAMTAATATRMTKSDRRKAFIARRA